MVRKRVNRNLRFHSLSICILAAMLAVSLYVFIGGQGAPSSLGQTSYQPGIVHMPVVNEPPTAVVTPGEARIQVGERLVLSGTSSYDPDGEIVQYLWSFSPGNSISRAQMTVQFSTQGTRTVVLTVVDDSGGEDSAVATIEVVELPPRPVLFLSAGLDNMHEIISGSDAITELRLVAYNGLVTDLRATVIDDGGLDVQVLRIPEEASPSETVSFSVKIRVPEDLEGPFGATIRIQVQGEQADSNVVRVEVMVPAQADSPDYSWELIETSVIVVAALSIWIVLRRRARE